MVQYELLIKISEVLEKIGIPYIVTGSVGAMAYGEPRFTIDIDIVAEVQKKHIQSLVAHFPKEEYYISEEMIEDAIEHNSQFNIIHPFSGLKIDIIIKKNSDFDTCRFNRKRKIFISQNVQAYFSSPEDIIVKKLEYYKIGGSDKHLRDIAGILKITKEIDRSYIENWVEKFDLVNIWNKFTNS